LQKMFFKVKTNPSVWYYVNISAPLKRRLNGLCYHQG